jgi:plastocyanin
MVRRLAPALGLLAIVLAACSGGGSATSEAPAASAAAPSVAGVCTSSSETGTVNVTMADLAFNPSQTEAAVGDVITWTNGDSAQHTATLDDGSCTTEILAAGATGSLTFSAPGTYAYHCKIHPSMTGTIEIS